MCLTSPPPTRNPRLLAVLTFLIAALLVHAADNVVITEFMASNSSGLADEDGAREDWVEIFNAGTNTVDLLNWSLTDNAGNLTKWRFPSTNIAPGRYMVVFASNKNRRTPGAPLHTNFRLDPNPGEYLALVRPDLTIAAQFSPAYPVQAQNISYGFAVTAATNTLTAAGTGGRFLVPTNFSHAPFWTDGSFDDSAWSNGPLGLGFNFPTNLMRSDIRAAMSNVNASVYLRVPFTVGDPESFQNLLLKMRYDDGFVSFVNGQEVARRNAPSSATNGVLADSTNDWAAGLGAQGYNNWRYGYYNRSIDTNDNTYSHLTDFNAADEQWSFTGGTWVLGPADPPWTYVGQTAWHPNGTNNAAAHWAIRRWTSPVSGVITARVSFAKASSGGNGATLRVMQNGEALTVRTIAGTDTVGFTTNIVLGGVEAGDVFDFALDPVGTDGQASDSTDTCVFTAQFTLAASGDLAWNSSANGEATSNQSTNGEVIDITGYKNFLFAGTNILAIQGLNISASDPDFLALPELLGVTTTVGTNQPVYFLTATPGAVNGTGTTNLGPLVLDVAHSPHEPASNEIVVVTARIVPTFNSVSNVTLAYRAMFNAETNVAMNDGGTNGDLVAGDGTWSARIPAGITAPGQMVRYGITSRDVANSTNRSPAYPTTRSPQYYGYIINDPSLNSKLPVIQWYVPGANFGGAATEAGTRGSIYFFGQFIDNIGMTLHGQSSSGFPKKSYNFNLNPGYRLTWNDNQPAIDDFALITTWADRAYLRYLATADTYAMAGATGHFTFAVRVQTNGVFHSVAHLTEQGNEEFLERVNYDPDGALYKIYNTLTTASGNEKKTRTWEPAYDLQALVAAANNADVNTRINYAYDNYNFPSMIAFLSAKGINADHDCCHKNFYLYRDSNISSEWYALPWDIDLSLGHVWTGTNGNYFDDTIYTNTPPYIGQNNAVFGVIFNDATLKSMWARRVRTLMDEVLQPPGTPTNASILHNLINYYATLVADDVVLDFAKYSGLARSWTPLSPVWGGPSNLNSSFATEVSRIRDYWLPGHRTYLNLSTVTNTFGLPPSQPSNAVVIVRSVDFNPASSNQLHEYVELRNTNNYAVDISGWRLDGGVSFTFKPGTVIPANLSLHVSPDVRAFRTRLSAPTAGQRAFAVGPYSGQLSARGEPLFLLNRTGQTNSSLTYTGAPSSVLQYLRITEIMYHPGPTNGGSLYGPEEFEYIELKNTSTNLSLNLNGVKFTNGILFSFTGSAVTNLAPGARCLVVKNNAAFVSRHGSGLPVAGVYSGSLDNAGERIQLLDASNEEIHDFSYNNSWYPITDGLGFSLVIVDENAQPDAWDSKSNWRASGQFNGAPGAADLALPAIAPVVVNEVLSHTDLPQTDAVELFNPTGTNVDIGGWFLTDSFFTPKKFRISAGTVIPPGGFVVFTETNFNTGPNAFAFSSTGEEVYLFSGDGATNLSGYFHGFDFGAIENGRTFGRHVNSQTNEDFVPQISNTLGATNSGPRVGPVVVSEIMYHPAALTTNDPPAGYVELVNIAATNVPLHNVAEPTNTWRLRESVDFDFPTNVTLAPGQTVLVVSFDPATNAAALASFRSRYGLSTNVPLFGPYSGSLPNDEGVVELKKPDFANSNGVPYVQLDRVHYHDSTPWPGLADGLGAALTRVVRGDYGNDPTNWVAAIPGPGTNFAPGAAPHITLQPVSQNVFIGTDVTFTVGATGTGPLQFQWTANGLSYPATTNASFTITNARRSHSGLYSVLIMSPYGSVLSDAAALLVQAPLVITAQPQSTNVFPGQTASFSVTVTGDSPFYQWRSNGVDIPGAGGSTFSWANAQPADAGAFTVFVSNAVSSAVSAPATLAVLLQPLILQHPLNLNVFASSNATFGVIAVSSTPLRYQWYFTNGFASTNASLTNYTALAGATNSLLFITNCQDANVGSYRVAVWDDYGTNVSSIANLDVQTKPVVVEGPFPTNLFRLTGSSLALSINVRGGLPIYYRWVRNGLTQVQTNVINHTTSVFTVSSVIHSNAGYYQVSLTNQFGSTTLGSRAYLTVMDPLTNRTVRAGSNSTFYALTSSLWNTNVAAGNSNLWPRWQWWFNGTNLLATGATNTTVYGISLNLTNIQTSNEGSYTLVVTNGIGTIATQTAMLTVLRPPAITADPTNIVVAGGQPANFSVAATGGSLFYQWRFNGADIPSADGSTFNIPAASAGDAGSYSVVVTNSEGSVTSQVATLTVWTAPVIATQPADQTVAAGATVQFLVGASGTPTPVYQWWFNGTNLLAGETNAALVLHGVTTGQAGLYSVLVSNEVGAVTSSNALLTVLSPPEITQQPVAQTLVAGSNATFAVVASGAGPLAYQWWFDGTNALAGATAATLALNGVQTTNAGAYHVTVSNSAGSVTSQVATLTVWTPPSISSQPTNLTVVAGADAEFTVVAAGSPAVEFQWWFNVTNLLAGQTAATLVLSNVAPANEGSYFVTVSNAAGTLTSTSAVLTVLIPPVITQQPTNITAAAGSNAVFNVAATGGAPLVYEWWFNGTNPVAGAAAATLTLTNVQATNAGGYHVVITNLAGSVTSLVATLTVANADSDGDGLPDAWETANGLNAGSSTGDNGANGDPDHDGATNLEEYIAGTDPQNTASRLWVELQWTPAGTNGNATIQFGGVAGRGYSVLYRDDLGAGSWQVLTNVATLPVSAPVAVQDSVPPGRPHRYYRLEVIPQP
jgi:hypothetical protein